MITSSEIQVIAYAWQKLKQNTLRQLEITTDAEFDLLFPNERFHDALYHVNIGSR